MVAQLTGNIHQSFFDAIAALALPLLSVKHAIALILFVCILCQCMVKLGVVAYYQYNKQYIAANLCENRDKPQLKCCGKCYLNKQLKKAEKGSEEGAGKSGPLAKNQWGESSPFIVPEIPAFSARALVLIQISPLAHYQQMPLNKVSGAIFHPPQA